jgi:hypothetical protein
MTDPTTQFLQQLDDCNEKIAALESENARLRAELEGFKAFHERFGEEQARQYGALHAELDRVTRERDAAVEDIKKPSVCECCKRHCQGEDECVDNDYMNFIWQGETEEADER